MKRIIPSDKKQGTLFAKHYVDDKLTATDEVYLFESLFNKLDISSIMDTYGTEGGSLYNPAEHLSVIIYAYFFGVTSSNQIAQLLRKNVEFIYLAGGHSIDARSIRRFRSRNKNALKPILLSSVTFAIESGLVKYSDVFSLDGTKIAAFASKEKTLTKSEWSERQAKIIEHVELYIKNCIESDSIEENSSTQQDQDLQKRFDEISSKISNLKKQSGSSSSSSNFDKSPSSKSKESKSEDKTKKKKKNFKIKVEDNTSANHLLDEVEDIHSLLESHEDSSPDLLLNRTDPDSRVMKNASKPKESYNAQIVTNNQIIVAADVTNAENDQHELIPMVSELKKNLAVKKNAQAESKTDTEIDISETDQKSDSEKSLKKGQEKQESQESTTDSIEVIDDDKIDDNKKDIQSQPPPTLNLAADAGYNRGANLKYLDEQKDIEAYVSMKNRKEEQESEENPYHRDHFEYNEDEDHYTCPEGKKLDFMSTSIRKGQEVHTYGAGLKECVHCPFNSLCITSKSDRKKGYRTIVDDGFNLYRREMKNKMQKDESKALYRSRSGDVEAVFGQIKENRNFRRFRLKGLEKVKAEFFLVTIVHNMGKIMKHMKENESITTKCA